MNLFFRKYGSGPPLFILHGLYGSSDNWIQVAKRLANDFCVYLPDLRNHGQSPHSEIHSYDSMAEDIIDLTQQLEIRRFFLAGHSMGGKVAMKIALNWPERLSGLIVADISPFSYLSDNSEEHNFHRQVLSLMVNTNLQPIKTRSEIETILTPVILSAKVRELIMKNIKRNADNSFSWKINAPVLLLNLDRIMDGIIPHGELIQEVAGFPVYFLKGEKSDYLNEHDYKKIERVFPAAKFIKISNAGHWIHSDNPDEVVNAFHSLLDE